MEYTISLKKNIEFKNVYSYGKSVANRQLVMYKLENNSDENRLGIVVSKKVGNSVVRHKIKRQIKEAYRLNENIFDKGFDIVIIARVGIREKNYHEIEKSLKHINSLKIS